MNPKPIIRQRSSEAGRAGRDRHLAQHARVYAAAGWPVLPLWWPLKDGACACREAECDRAGKHPIHRLTQHGLRDATTDVPTLAAWWRACPEANIGVRTGTKSGLVVLDVDGGAGVNTLRELAQEHGRFHARWAQTGSGWHAYMAHPAGEPVTNSAKRLGPGLDVRGEGGYAVVPPSLHVSGRRYRWLSEDPLIWRAAELPAMPDWLVELARPDAGRPSAGLGPTSVRADRVGGYAAAALDAEAAAVAATPSGQRNSRLNMAAYRLGQLVGASMLSECEVIDGLLPAAKGAGLRDRESLITIRSGLRAGARQPRRVELRQAAPKSREAEAC